MIQRLRFALATLGAALLCGLAAPAWAEQPSAEVEAGALVQDMEGFEPEGQVQLDVRFVAVDGSLPLDLADSLEPAALVRAAPMEASSEPIATRVRVRRIADRALDEQLTDLHADGNLRILARTSLLAASGSTAEWEGSGLAPLTTPDGRGVGFRAYGTRLVLHPRVSADGVIQLAIRGELTGDGQDADGPRQVVANERLRHGETLLVAHLFDDAAAGPPPKPRWFARTPLGKAVIKSRPPPAQTQLALIVTARLPADSNPERVLATLTAEDLEAPALPKARGPPLRRAFSQLVHKARAALGPPLTGARASLSWSARLMVRTSRVIARA